jgi:peptidoglycan lytic transglycosylase
MPVKMSPGCPSFRSLSGSSLSGSSFSNLVWVGALGLCLILSGCATSRATRATPPTEAKPEAKPEPGPRKEQTGEASWYGEPHHGRPTASGEIYDMYKLTAAHRTLPLGTRVLVTNLKNGRAVEVRINDRGPSVDGRIIDLSYAAARELGGVSGGTIPVRIRVLSTPSP